MTASASTLHAPGDETAGDGPHGVDGAGTRQVGTGSIPEIDGLRAVAVGLVVLFHFGASSGRLNLPGGALGVDVFFVISGFLITRLLVVQLVAGGGIALRRFYARRVVRLVPASMLVLAVTAVLLLRVNVVDRAGVAKEFAPALLGYANWHLIAVSRDYWAAQTSVVPLQHYWSLAVEEQFYLVWPSFLLLAWHWCKRSADPLRRLGAIAAVLAAGSLGLWLLASRTSSATYFSTQYRMGEILVGAVCALVVLRRSEPLPRWAAAAGCAAFFPVLAWVALRPVAGNIALWGSIVSVFTGFAVLGLGGTADRPWVGPLRWRPVVYIGQISYGIYLWHFPVDQLLPDVVGHRIAGRKLLLVKLVVTLALSAASYAALEHPLRLRAHRSGFRPSRVLVIGLASIAVAAALLPFAVDRSVELPRAGLDGRELVVASRDFAEGSCHGHVGDSYCVRRQAAAGRPVLATLGDSHVWQWDPAWIGLAEANDATYLRAELGTCQALPGIKPADDVTACAARRSAYVDDLRHLGSPTVAVFAIRPTLDQPPGVRPGPFAPRVAAARAVLQPLLHRLSAAGIPTVLLTPIPEFPGSLPRCLAETAQPGSCDIRVADGLEARRQQVVTMIREVADAEPGVVAVPLDELVCPAGRCASVVDGQVTRADKHHLTKTYAGILAPRLMADIRAAGCAPGGELAASWLCATPHA